MKGILISCLLLFVLSANFQTENDILILNDDNIEEALEEYSTLVIQFYAPWCRVSKALAPEFKKAAESLKKLSIPSAMIDATQNKKASLRASVLRYPSIKLYLKNEFMDYTGNNTDTDIVAFIKKETEPRVKALSTIEAIEQYKTEHKAIIVYFGNDAKELDILEKIAKEHDHYHFALCTNTAVSNQLNSSKRKLIVLKQFDELKNEYTKDILIEEEVLAFIVKHANPTVQTLDMNSMKVLFGEASSGLFFFRDEEDEKTEELDRLFNATGNKMPGRIFFVLSDMKEGFGLNFANHLGITEEELPIIIIQEIKANLNYRMQGDITEANIMQFVKDWEEGKLQPFRKSEEIPIEQKGPVYTLVGNSFDDVVLKNDKNVLVKFYAPWCGHCKKLAPIYNQLAEKYKNDKTMLIAEIDATLNDVDGVQIEGYPTLLFWKGDKKNEPPVMFDGEGTLAGLEEFIKEQLNPRKKTEEKGNEQKKEEQDRKQKNIKEDL